MASLRVVGSLWSNYTAGSVAVPGADRVPDVDVA
jgi:hypothetical protein